ncbi:hypothetical protein DVK85_03110 [Flavobacterium arcticum]|uniref:Uncharacterized protein n=2 Tax=Flavobacterium arcticum TaxID=1784713 RepID=A0A345H9K8_9FLAO|nr:hypothetical protein DVK85_03110 [Flavobacterium arcticum]
MVNSNEYISLKKNREIFIGKMNFTGKVSDIDTKAKLLSWINTNISITDFANYNEAETGYDNLLASEKIVTINNLEFYKELQKEPSIGGSFLNLTEPEPVPTDACGCGSAYSLTMAGIAADRAADYDAATSVTDLSDFDSIDDFAGAVADMNNCYQAAIDQAWSDFRLCIYNCN